MPNNKNPKIYRTDYDFTVKLFGNPISWIEFYFIWNSKIWYGFKLGFILIMIEITQYAEFNIEDEFN